MQKRNENDCTNRIGSGTSMGVVFGFLLGMLVNSIFIPIGIALGVAYDTWKNKRDKE